MFKMTGLVLADPDVVSAMDTGITKDSKVIPVGFKQDGSFTARSSVATLQEMTELRQRVATVINETAEEMLNGKIAAVPYKKRQSDKKDISGCKYCKFGAICSPLGG
jgi:ATP-dependent helicase/nuclease subunit B